MGGGRIGGEEESMEEDVGKCFGDGSCVKQTRQWQILMPIEVTQYGRRGGEGRERDIDGKQEDDNGKRESGGRRDRD